MTKDLDVVRTNTAEALWGTEDTLGVFDEVATERLNQDKRFGEQNHPDIGGPNADRLRQYYSRNADDHRHDNDHRGDWPLAWDGILLEEVYEALAESDPAKLRAELVQVAAVAVAWIEAIDRRTEKT